MISAEQFARHNSVWHQATPTLEQYTRWVNRNHRAYERMLLWVGDPQRNSLIAETAFVAFARDTDPAGEAEVEARRHIVSLPRGGAAADALNQREVLEATVLKRQLAKFVEVHTEPPLVVSPVFRGCGVVESARGDLLARDQLIEIKAVQRPFRGADFRQVLTYAALDYTRGSVIRRVTLVNPRFGTYFRSSVTDLALDIGAGSWVELMQDLVDAMTGLQVSP